MIKRDLYLEEIKKYMNKPLIKVITGMRRSGKSMILKLIHEELKKHYEEYRDLFDKLEKQF